MRKIVFVFFILFIFSTSLLAGEIYTYKDKYGNTVISNEPIPEKYEKKAKKIHSYEEKSREEIERYEAESRQVHYNQVQPNQVQPNPVQQNPVQQNNYNSSSRSSSKVDKTCKRECDIDKNTCISDCSRHSGSYKSRNDTDNYERASCKGDCTTTYNNCVNRCYD